ncbi:MAG: MFS transporter [Coriobacteriales bacterium]|jgi:NNP family nitrate/nitrite transporter-like MFS transporter|nr:MFS transporter [Coriobacteriales bacterium]
MQQTSSKRWVILFVIILGQTLGNFSNLIFSARSIDVMAQFHMVESQLAVITTVGILPALLLSIVIGNLMDRKGMKGIISIGLGITAVFMIWRIWADSFMMLLIITIVIGIVGLPFQIGAAKMLGVWFPKKEMPLAVGFFGAAAGLGTTLAFFLGNIFPSFTFSLTVIGVVSVAVLALWVLFAQDRNVAGTGEEVAAPPKPPKNALILVLKSPSVWKITIISGLAIGTALLINIYMVMALSIQKGMTPQEAGLATGLLNICLLLGSTTWSIVVRRIALINIPHAVACIGGGVLYACAWFLPFGVQTFVLIALAGIIVSGSIGINTTRVPLLPLAKEFGMECVATANGVNNTGIGILAFLTPTVVSMIAGGNFNLVFIINTVICIAIGLLSLSIPELGEKGKLAKQARDEAAEK